MKTIKRLGTIAAAFALLSTLALAAPKTERKNKYFTVTGTVLQIDKTARTLLIEDRAASQNYLIEVPKGATFKIVFGRYMRMEEPGFNDVNVRERVKIRCLRGDTDHLARLDDGRQVVLLTASR